MQQNTFDLPSFEGFTNFELSIWPSKDPFADSEIIGHRELCKLKLDFTDSDSNPQEPIYFNVPIENGASQLIYNGANYYAKRWDASLREAAKKYYKAVWELYKTKIRDTKYACGWSMHQWGPKFHQKRRRSVPFAVAKVILAKATSKFSCDHYVIVIQMGHTSLHYKVQRALIDNAPFGKGYGDDPIAKLSFTILKDTIRVNNNVLKEISLSIVNYSFEDSIVPDSFERPVTQVLSPDDIKTEDDRIKEAFDNEDWDNYNSIIDHIKRRESSEIKGSTTNHKEPKSLLGMMYDKLQKGLITPQEYQHEVNEHNKVQAMFEAYKKEINK